MMKPDADYVIRSLGTHLAKEILPHVDTDYAKADLRLIVRLLFAAAMDFDQAAARLIEENRQMRRIFADALPMVSDVSLKSRLSAVLENTEEDYRVSSLGRENASLRQCLIDLHAHMEALDGPEARDLEEAIWRELSASTQRRLSVMMGIATAAALFQCD